MIMISTKRPIVKVTSHLPRLALIVVCVLALGPNWAFAARSPQRLEERGTVKSVDTSAHVLVITDLKDKTEHSFQWNDKTKFASKRSKATPADLTEGERVRIAYTPGGDKPMLKRVQLVPAKPRKHAANHFRPRRSEVQT